VERRVGVTASPPARHLAARPGARAWRCPPILGKYSFWLDLTRAVMARANAPATTAGEVLRLLASAAPKQTRRQRSGIFFADRATIFVVANMVICNYAFGDSVISGAFRSPKCGTDRVCGRRATSYDPRKAPPNEATASL